RSAVVPHLRLEVNLLVYLVRIEAAQVDVHATRTQIRPGDAPVDRVRGGNLPDALGPHVEDLRLLEDALVLVVDLLEEMFDAPPAHRLEILGEVVADSADAGVVLVHPGAGHQLDQVEEQLRLSERPEEAREDDVLLELADLHDLLVAAMEVADLRLRVGHRLPVDLDLHVPEAMGHRVLRAHVDPELRHHLPPRSLRRVMYWRSTS